MFRLRVIDKIPEPPSIEALRGTIVHSVLEHLFDASPADRTPQTALDLLEPTWQAELEKHPEHTELFESPTHIEEWLDSARVLIGNYFKMENPQFLEPAAREQFVNATLPSGLHLRGIIDRVDVSPNGQTRVVDYKTGKSPAPRYQSGAIFQMQFYAAALYLSAGELPTRTQLIYLKDGRTLTYDPVMEDVSALGRELDSTWSAIEECLDTGQFEPKKTPLCNWCNFQEHCPLFGGQPPAMSGEGAAALRTAKA